MSKQLKNKEGSANKKFAVRPFSSIKGMTVEKPSVEASPAVTSSPAREPASPAEDDLLFLTEMSGVTRIHSRPVARRSHNLETVSPEKRQLSEEPDESLVFLDALKELKLDVRFTDELADTVHPVTRRRSSRMRQLRRGTIQMNLEIDLHGLTCDEALDALVSFIPAASRRGQQAILVITGKGVHSEGEPVLQGAVANWLSSKGKEWVPEFLPAPESLGGAGAYIVFLKAGK